MKPTTHHKSILNAIGIFGSMHFINMLISVFRSKIVALWLGAYGIGMLGLFISAINLIMSVVNMGLPTSIVRYLAGEKEEKLSKKLKILNIILIISGILGAVFTLIFSAQISILTFGDTTFSWAFRLISISIIFKQISTGYTSILQSQSKIKLYANANLMANILGIIITLPMYYYFQINGIVYNIITISIVEIIIFYFFIKKLKLPQKEVKYSEVKQEAKGLMKQSFSFMFSGFITLFSAFLVQTFVNKNSNYETLGVYIAGYSILNTYVAIIFTVMGIEYFPRISKIETASSELSAEVNNQLYIGILFLTPILLALLLFAPLVIRILYSNDFLESIHYIYLALLGVFFKLFSFVIGYVIISKGNERLIFSNSLIYNTLFTIIHCLGFYFYQLKGIAIASTLYYLCHLLGNYYVVYSIFSLKINNSNLLKYTINVLIIPFSIFIYYFAQRD